MKPLKIGILGGGQLGKMLCQAASSWDVETYILDEQDDFPAALVCHQFVTGNFKNYDDVMSFAALVDVMTIEIESVNIEALHALKKQGKLIFPDPDALAIIKDKGLQKSFYQQHNIPTSTFQLFDTKKDILAAIESGLIQVPFVQKSRTDGYDGKGVQVIHNMYDVDNLMDVPSVIEPLIDIDKEIAVIAARNRLGEISVFPVVEMAFHPTANLVEMLFSPSSLSAADEAAAIALARHTIAKFDTCGLLAVEMFVTKSGELLINEVAPRPHNSGHHSIEACYTSQFQQHIRTLLDIPMGSTALRQPAAMINLLGEEGHSGVVRYHGVDETLSIEGCYVHLYGKKTTKPFRKMGHITCVDNKVANAIEKARKAQKSLKVFSV